VWLWWLSALSFKLSFRAHYNITYLYFFISNVIVKNDLLKDCKM